MKRIFAIIICGLLLGTVAKGQLNTASPLYLSYAAASVSYGSERPYTIPKKVATNETAFRNSDNVSYTTAFYLDAEFAVFKNKRNKHTAYQIILVERDFTLLCEHYAAAACDCREGLHIFAEGMEEPLRIRRIWPFSLKTNLVDGIDAKSEIKLATENFETVCEILEYLEFH
ncbi:MAG: hypothetical protein WBG42_11055 [Cryomorphaceae bacterium]